MPTDQWLKVEPYWTDHFPNLSSIDWKPKDHEVDEIWGKEQRRVMAVKAWPEGEPKPWLVNVGGDEETNPEWYVQGVRDFFEELAPMGGFRERRFTKREKPLLAIPLVGTRGGGGGEKAGEVVKALLPVLYEGARRDVDIALCLFNGPAYAAAIYERREFEKTAGSSEVWPRELTYELRDKAENLARKAKSGELALFIGAGLSASADLPDWKALLARLAEKVGIISASAGTNDPRRNDFERLNNLDRARLVADYFTKEGSHIGKEVAAIIKERRHYSVGHAALAALPVKEVITTNYDSLFEIASCYAQDEDAILRVIPYEADKTAERWILKMHGCVQHPQDIVLTRTDYLRYDDNRAALKGIVQALLITRHILFVGFSLTDDNFHGIIEEVRKAIRAEGRCSSCGMLQTEPRGEIPDTHREQLRGRVAHKPPEKFGTALSPARNQFLKELWDKDLSWRHFHEEENQEAYRIQEIFLDYLASLSVSAVHLMDPRYDKVLTHEERLLRNALTGFIDGIDKEAKKAPAWKEIEALVKRFGG